MTPYLALSCALRRRGKVSFLRTLKPSSKILDVGCGNDSPYRFKRILPNCDYTGIDVGDYHQTKPNLADRYIITKPEDFAGEIAKISNEFDAVVSSHNLEHCNDRVETLSAMLRSVKPGGVIYLSFPCENSVNFPHRQGTLSYFDDATHRDTPPNFNDVMSELINSGFEVKFSAKRYRPAVLWLLGLFVEPISSKKRRVLKGTWEFYGFESVIWAKKAK